MHWGSFAGLVFVGIGGAIIFLTWYNMTLFIVGVAMGLLGLFTYAYLRKEE